MEVESDTFFTLKRVKFQYFITLAILCQVNNSKEYVINIWNEPKLIVILQPHKRSYSSFG
jgi:hypothetical protein